MKTTLAFDVYGTLIDTHGVVVELAKHVGANAAEFSRVWRDKQLEYSFRRGLMRKYESFAVCTRNALDYTNEFFNASLSRQAKDGLLNAYTTLPAFADAREGLARAKEAGFRMYAFSNGSAEAVEKLLVTAGIRDCFVDVVSVDEIKSFKPDPAVYAHFLQRACTDGARAWLVSSNPFDVIGAMACGMRAAWVRRSPQTLYDPWSIEPTIVVDNLSALPEKINAT